MNRKVTYFVVFNGVWFQFFWWLLILKLDQAVLVGAALLLLHTLLTPKLKSDLMVLVLVMPFGCLFDALMHNLGVIVFNGVYDVQGFPVWLILLWCAFAFTVNYSLGWLQHLSSWVISVVGGLSAAGSYFAGAKLGAAEINVPVLFWSLYPVMWAVLLLMLYKKWLQKAARFLAQV